MIPISLMSKLQETFCPLVKRVQGVRDVLVSEESRMNPASNEDNHVVLVVIDDDQFAETSAVVLSVFNAVFEGTVSGLSVSLRMRPLRPDSLRMALGYGSEWHPCVKPMTGGTNADR